jgi:hypothetical protein
MSYDQSKHVIQVGAFDRQWAFVASQNFHSIVIVVPLMFKIFSSSQKVNSLLAGHLPDMSKVPTRQRKEKKPAICLSAAFEKSN